jgi:hypothetical protein
MRIVYVLTSLGVGGAERQAISLAERMAARGHAVALLVLRDSQPEQWPTTLDPVHFNMSRTPASLLAGLWEARRFLRDFHPDLIHSHTYPANMMARLLKILHPATAVLSTVHNVYEGSLAAYAGLPAHRPPQLPHHRRKPGRRRSICAPEGRADRQDVGPRQWNRHHGVRAQQ